MKVQQVLLPHWLSFIYSIVIVIAAVADYASALQQPPPQLEPQPPRAQEQPTALLQKQPQHAEVNYTAGETLNFGSKVVEYPVDKPSSNMTAINATHHEKQQQQHNELHTIIQASDTVNIASASRVARRYDAPIVPATQLVAEYDVPLLKKSRGTNNSTTNSSPPRSKQQGSGSLSNSRDDQSVAASSGQRSNSLGSQAQSSRQSIARNRARNPNVTTVARQQPRRRDDRRSEVDANQQSSLPTASTGSRREVNKSRNDVSAKKTAPNATTTTTTSTSTSTSTPTISVAVRPPSIVNSISSNPFSFFSPAFWSLSSPPKVSSTKKPPKKYTPSPPIATSTPRIKEKKNNYQKEKVTTTVPTISNEIHTTTAAPRKSTTDGPFRIALPTFNLFNAPAQRSNEPISEKDKRNIAQNLRNQFNCPRESEVRFQLFPKICKTDEDCTVWNRDELCCDIFGAKSCVSGISKPLEETSHTPILGLIPRKCPTRPLAELWWQVQECETDTDCWPRVCCPDGNKRYCRTSQPELETVPVPVKRSFNYLSEYLECTPPPPPIFDLHPKTCASTLDCFPNVCCQESGLRHCRPPKKSLLTLMANFLNVDFVKKLAQNIVIK